MDKEFKKYQKSDTFKVPENYFEDFALKMQNEIAHETLKAPSFWERLTYALQLRLTLPLSIVLVLTYLVIEFTANSSGTFSDKEIQSYIMYESDFWSEDELLDLAYGEKQSLVMSDNELIHYLEEESSEEELYLRLNQ